MPGIKVIYQILSYFIYTLESVLRWWLPEAAAVLCRFFQVHCNILLAVVFEQILPRTRFYRYNTSSQQQSFMC